MYALRVARLHIPLKTDLEAADVVSAAVVTGGLEEVMSMIPPRLGVGFWTQAPPRIKSHTTLHKRVESQEKRQEKIIK
jgi:hypothetical protein